MRKNILVFIGVCIFSSPVFASSKSDATFSKADNADQLKMMADRWGIIKEDYARYLNIIEGPLGRWNPNIDPVLALGIYARNDEEEKRFAKIYAKQEYTLVTRTQAFERAYRNVFSSMYPNAEVIADKYMKPYYDNRGRKNGEDVFKFSKESFKENDRLIYFVDHDCDYCEPELEQLYWLIESIPGLVIDVYILGISDESQARQWVGQHRMNIALIQEGKLTVNIDDGVFEKMKGRSMVDTRFYLSRGESLFSINPTDIYFQ